MSEIAKICENAKNASANFAACATEKKNEALSRINELLTKNADKIKEANALDLAAALKTGLAKAFVDRLTLSDKVVLSMQNSIKDVISLPDYVGKVEEKIRRKNGLKIKKVRAPLGVIGIIYESRPNVTVDAAVLCLKSGNAVVLRGGKDAINSNRCLANLMKEALTEVGLSPDLVGFINSIDREDTKEMLKSRFVDVVIPRGGEALKKFVLENAEMPVIASSGGTCHVYVDKCANLETAKKVAVSAKISRPSTCNSAEAILVHKQIADAFLPELIAALKDNGVEIRGDKAIGRLCENAGANFTELENEEENYKEYNDLIVRVAVVDTIEDAVAHINKYGTNHSDAIITDDKKAQKYFASYVDSGAVYINASTRFTDGYEFGLGAEMGISTQKLHVRGPIGLKELTSVKYVVTGNGHIR